MPENNLIAITMPGFGTTDRTYYNALSLISALGADNRDISIKASVLQHFEDIGHDPSVRDVTYENAQARERTQILMDVANSCRGLVVGTGDMSEDALGWCTFGGDHLASYNVNVCLTKTMIRRMVTHLCSRFDEQISSILHDIVDTPVSPELLPPDESGKIQQKTEDIRATMRCTTFSCTICCATTSRRASCTTMLVLPFSGELSASYILEKLKLFLNRFFAGQFKRSCTRTAPASPTSTLPAGPSRRTLRHNRCCATLMKSDKNRFFSPCPAFWGLDRVFLLRQGVKNCPLHRLHPSRKKV